MLRIGRAVLPVKDLAAAIAWYEKGLGFGVLFDREIFPGFRSIHVGPDDVQAPGIWLFPAESVNPAAQPALVLYSDDITSDAARLASADAEVVKPLHGETGNRSLQVRDPSGNTIVIAEMP